eukprot:SAG31_NODE_1261_length_9072_cov_39.512761_3_plen_82_part_00
MVLHDGITRWYYTIVSKEHIERLVKVRGGYSLVFLAQLSEKYGTLIERCTALIEKVSVRIDSSAQGSSPGMRGLWPKWCTR